MRSRRLTTLQSVVDLNPLPVDAEVADHWARLRLQLAQAGQRVNVNDTWMLAEATADPDLDGLAAFGAQTSMDDLG